MQQSGTPFGIEREKVFVWFAFGVGPVQIEWNLGCLARSSRHRSGMISESVSDCVLLGPQTEADVPSVFAFADGGGNLWKAFHVCPYRCRNAQSKEPKKRKPHSSTTISTMKGLAFRSVSRLLDPDLERRAASLVGRRLSTFQHNWGKCRFGRVVEHRAHGLLATEEARIWTATGISEQIDDNHINKPYAEAREGGSKFPAGKQNRSLDELGVAFIELKKGKAFLVHKYAEKCAMPRWHRQTQTVIVC